MSMLLFDPPKAFSFEPNQWPLWKENFERYNIASSLAKLSDEEQINALIYVIELKANNIFKSFTFGKDEDGKKFVTVLQKFDALFLPHKNLIHERYRFFSRNQLINESIEEYITQLYKFSEICEFEKMEPHTIRDHIVVSIADSEFSKKLQLQSHLTHSKVVEMVRTYDDLRHQHEEQRPNEHQINRVRKNQFAQSTSCGLLILKILIMILNYEIIDIRSFKIWAIYKPLFVGKSENK